MQCERHSKAPYSISFERFCDNSQKYEQRLRAKATSKDPYGAHKAEAMVAMTPTRHGGCRTAIYPQAVSRGIGLAPAESWHSERPQEHRGFHRGPGGYCKPLSLRHMPTQCKGHWGSVSIDRCTDSRARLSPAWSPLCSGWGLCPQCTAVHAAHPRPWAALSGAGPRALHPPSKRPQGPLFPGHAPMADAVHADRTRTADTCRFGWCHSHADTMDSATSTTTPTGTLMASNAAVLSPLGASVGATPPGPAAGVQWTRYGGQVRAGAAAQGLGQLRNPVAIVVCLVQYSWDLTSSSSVATAV